MSSNSFISIRFKAIYQTKENQSIKVLGNIKELGRWDISKGVNLRKSKIDNNIWLSDEILVNKSQLIERIHMPEDNFELSQSDQSNNTNNLTSSTNSNLYREIKNQVISESSRINHRRNTLCNQKIISKIKYQTLEFKYVIFENNIFSHWEILSENSNHVVDIDLLSLSHIILVTNKFQIPIVIESGLKFKSSLPDIPFEKDKLKEHNDAIYNNYELEKFNSKLLSYIDTLVRGDDLNKKKDYYFSNFESSKKSLKNLKYENNLSFIMPTEDLANFTSSDKDLNSINNLHQKFYSYNKYDDDKEIRKKSDLGIIGDSTMLNIKNDKHIQDTINTSFIYKNFKNESRSIFDDILLKDHVVISSAFLPCVLYVNESSIQYKDNKIDITSIELGITIVSNSFFYIFFSIIKKYNKNKESFSWVGFISNYFDIIHKLGIDEKYVTEEHENEVCKIDEMFDFTDKEDENYKESKDNDSSFSSKNSKKDMKNSQNSRFDEEENIHKTNIKIINSKIDDLLKDYHLHMIKINYKTYNSFKKIIVEVLEPMSNYLSFFENLDIIQNYEMYYEGYKRFNRIIAEKINLLSIENTMILVQNIHLFLTPSYLYNFSKSFKITFWMHLHFPSSDVFNNFPHKFDILKSLLKCNMIGFHTYSSSRNFMTTVRNVLRLNYTSNHQGQILFSIFGRVVYIVVQTITSDKVEIQKLMKSKEFQIIDSTLKKSIGDTKYVWLAIDAKIYCSGIKHKILVFKKFLSEIKDKAKRFLYIQFIYEVTNKMISDEEKIKIDEEFSSIRSIVEEINKEYSKEVIRIQIKELSLVEKLALMANSNCFIKVSKKEPFNLDVYDFMVVKQIQLESLYKSIETNKLNKYFNTNNKETTLNYEKGNNLLPSFGSVSSDNNINNNSNSNSVNNTHSSQNYDFNQKIMMDILKKHPKLISFFILSENNEATNALNSAFRTNLFDLERMENLMFLVYEKLSRPKESDIINICNDMRICLKNTISTWITSWTVFLKQEVNKKEKLIKKGFGLQMDVVKIMSDFTYLTAEDLILKYSNTVRRLLVFNPEGFFMSKEIKEEFEMDEFRYLFNSENNKNNQSDNFHRPYNKIIAKIKIFCQDRNNIVIIISNRPKEILEEWFQDIDNIILVAECGYYTLFKGMSNRLSFKTILKDKIVDDEWVCLLDNFDMSWIEEVYYQLKPYSERCEDSKLILNETSIIWNFSECDAQQSNSFLGTIFNEFEEQLKKVDVLIEKLNDKIVIRPRIVCKENYINFFLSTLTENHIKPELIVYIGDSSDEKIYKSLNKYNKIYPELNIFTIVVGEKLSNARFYLNDRKDAYRVLKAISRITCSNLKSDLNKKEFCNENDEVVTNIKRKNKSTNTQYKLNTFDENED